MQRFLITAAFSLAFIIPAKAGIVTCNERLCSDWRTPHVVQEPVRRAGRLAKRVRYHVVREAYRAKNLLNGIVAPLAAKASEIEAACGSRVISGVRHTYVAGTHRISLHASGRAVDMQGNPSCIYAHLRNWPGGVSIDYARVNHVHFSYDPNGREWGARFAHGGGRTRYARHRNHHHSRMARR